jgi:hypothetical protein
MLLQTLIAWRLGLMLLLSVSLVVVVVSIDVASNIDNLVFGFDIAVVVGPVVVGVMLLQT